MKTKLMKWFVAFFMVAAIFTFSATFAACGGDDDGGEDADLAALRTQLQEKTTQITGLQTTIASKEAELAELTEVIDYLEPFIIATLDAKVEVTNNDTSTAVELGTGNKYAVEARSTYYVKLSDVTFTPEKALDLKVFEVVFPENTPEYAYNVVYDEEGYGATVTVYEGPLQFEVKLSALLDPDVKVAPVFDVSDTYVKDNPADANKTKIVVGTPKMNGDFISGFGNSSYDKNIKDLLAGYGTVWETKGGEWIWDKFAVLVEDPIETGGEEQADGSYSDMTYTFKLQQDLKYSDGSPIDASDYVFSLLWYADDLWTSKGASTEAGYYYIGYADYHSGASEVFEGVKLIDKYTFSVTIDGSQLPYFYLRSLAAVGPEAYKVLFPGATVETDPVTGGAKIGGTGYTAEAIDNNILAAGTGHRYAPKVTSGPYKFVSFKNQVARLEKNEYYKGTGEGNQTEIDIIEQKWVNSDTDVYQLIAGELDIVEGVIEADKIEAVKASTTAKPHTYERNGYGMIAMHCDFGPTAEPEVRRALGYLVDREEFVEKIMGGYATVVDGCYGNSQWFAQAKATELAQQLTHFTLNIDKANEELDKSTYKFEADGVTPFDKTKAGPDYYRYNAEGEVLAIHHMGSENNDVTDLVGTQLAGNEGNCVKAGIKFDLQYADFATLLGNYYGGYQLGAERYYHTFNLATGFTAAYDPYWSWHSDNAYKYQYNVNQLQDAEIDRVTKAMTVLEPGANDDFADLFLQFQIRWNELLPNIPLYSNTYFDMHSTRIEALVSTPTSSWAQTICETKLAD